MTKNYNLIHVTNRHPFKEFQPIMYSAAELVWKASEFAKKAHKGQLRKYTLNIPYITHPARVASQVHLLEDYCGNKHDIAVMISVAWMHDVMEDCGVTRGDLILEGFPNDVIDGIEALTNPSKNHPELNRAARKQMDREHLATIEERWRILKLIDRIDNLKDMVWAPHDFMQKYLEESTFLKQSLKIPYITWLEGEFTYTSNFLMYLSHKKELETNMERFRECEY